MNCTVSAITEQDILGFHAALDIVAKERIYLAFNAAPPLEKAHAFVMSNIQNDYPQFVARDGGKVVGWCDVSPATGRDTTQHVGTLGIGLLPGYRGKGIGQQLLQAAINKAWRYGLTRIELTVREKNKNAIALYQKLGFEIEGLKKNSSIVNDAYENDYFMALLKP